jgi:hypothetical protein
MRLHVRCDNPKSSGLAAARGKVLGPAIKWSGWRDLNSRPLDPQSSALTKLRHSPFPVSRLRKPARA